MERMLRAGYGVFSWDKPGTGDSTGDIDPQQTFETYDEYVHKCKGNRSVLPPSFVFTISQPGR